MRTTYEMQHVQLFVLESDQWRGEALDQAILHFLQRQGAAGATVVRGVAGFGSHRFIHQALFVDMGSDLPLVITWIDRADRVARLLPQIEAMLNGGLVVSLPVLVHQVAPRLLEHFPHDLQVRQVMTPNVVAVGPDTPLAEVADLLLHSGVRTIPVVDGEHHVVGIVSDGDLLRKADVALPLSIREALHPDEIAAATPPTPLRARDVMTNAVVTVRDDTPIATAIDVMAVRGLKRVPVLDRADHLAGIVSRADILQTVAHVAPHAAPTRTPAGAIQQVAKVMQTEVPTVHVDTPLTEVVEALAGVAQRRVVVVDGRGGVMGIITDGDVIRRASAEERPSIVRRMVDRLRGTPVEHARYLLVSGRTAADVMTTPVITLAADATPAAAIRLMQEHHIKRIPVLDAQGHMVGLLGRAGVLQALSEAT